MLAPPSSEPHPGASRERGRFLAATRRGAVKVFAHNIGTTRHKESYVKETSRTATTLSRSGLARSQRRALATRDASLTSDGSGAPSGRGRRALLGLAAIAISGLVFSATAASAAKEVQSYFGDNHDGNSNPAPGGELNGARDLAVNTSGAGPADAGDIYVADEFNNRIQRFDSNGNFISAWGANVLTAPVNERQTITVTATGGSYRLSFKGAETADIPYNAGSGTVQTALRNLPTVGGNNLEVSGSGPYNVTFTNSLSATNVAQIAVADESQLSGTVTTAHPAQGVGQYEICTVKASCRAGVETGAPNDSGPSKNGSLDSPQSVAVDQDTGNVFVSDRDNFRINEYTGDGTFIRSFGFDVDATEPGTGYEVCPAADLCKNGTSGAGVGQIGAVPFTNGVLGIAVSQPDGEAAVGKVFLADSGNRRVNAYELDGTAPSSFGSSANFGESQPRKIAVDSRGIVYASDSENGAEIDRYDSEDANGGGVGFLASIPAPPLLEGYAPTASSGLAIDPDSDGAGPDQDVLYVLRDPYAGNKRVLQFGPTNDPGLTVPPAAVDATHGAGAAFSSVNGLAQNETTGQLIVSAYTGVFGTYRDYVFILDDNVAPTATLDPITNFDAHSAELTGSVNPNGFYAKYRFEYVANAEFEANGFTNATRVPIADAQAGKGTAVVPVAQDTPHHLVPGTTYHVRLVAGQVFSPTEVVGGPLTFTTPGASPGIAGPLAAPSTAKATLRAAINPENQAVTNYHFNWGTTGAYGNTTPAGSLPTGTSPAPISAELTGLTPGTTYHYQLVATNGTGTTTGPDQTFTTFAQQPGLGPKRGYEMVSQYPTGGIPMVPGVTVPDVSPDGNRALFGSVQPLPGSVTPVEGNHVDRVWMYGSDRTPSGWKLQQTGVARLAVPWGASIDLSREISQMKTGLDPDDQNGAYDLYERQPDGTFVWISRDPRIPVGTPQTAPGGVITASTEFDAGSGGGPDTPWTMSEDGSTVVFKSTRPLLDDDPGTAGGFDQFLYKWEEGQLSFVAHRPDGSVPSQVNLHPDLGSGGGAYRNTVSRDGSRVIWSAPRNASGGGRTLYVQIDGQPTVEAVKETGVPTLSNPEPYNVEYRGADSDVGRVFFSSSSRLTPDSGATTPEFGQADSDLYVYDVAANKVRDLTPRLDGRNDPAVDPATADRGRLLGVSSVSEDGKRVYFVADAQYDVAPNPLGELPSPVGRNLYLAELDGIDDPINLRFVGALGPGTPETGDGPVWKTTSLEKMAYANPDGSVLGFASTEDLTGQPIGGLRQMYAYNADRNTLECASCPTNGSLPKDEVDRFPIDPSGLTYGQHFQHGEGEVRWVSSRGTVFFDTVVPLVAADQNQTDDVYEFNAGEVRLISGGTGSNSSKFENASVDGSSVFFTSTDTLAPQDEEPGVNKLYVAREGGGFPKVPTQPPCDINAGACEGAGTSEPQLPGAGSAQFSGPGNVEESDDERCKRLEKTSRKLAEQARSLRRSARRTDDPKRAAKLRAKANRVQQAARKRAAAAKRCSASARGSNSDRRAH